MMNPIKTEYKDRVFDSKSEAVFARTLDLAKLGWTYHPHESRSAGLQCPEYCGHAWDFELWPVDWRPNILVEYKPGVPTGTYIENLTKKVRQNPVESFIVWGNPWDSFKTNIHADYIKKWPGYQPCSYVVWPIFTRWKCFGFNCGEWGDEGNWKEEDSDKPFSYRHHITDMFGITEEIAKVAKAYRFDLV